MSENNWERIDWEKLKRFDAKMTFLHKVKGNEIMEEQDRINSSPNMVVVATQIIPWNKVVKFKDEEVMLYDCFIYYKVRNKIGDIVIPEDTFKKEKTMTKNGEKK